MGIARRTKADIFDASFSRRLSRRFSGGCEGSSANCNVGVWPLVVVSVLLLFFFLSRGYTM